MRLDHLPTVAILILISSEAMASPDGMTASIEAVSVLMGLAVGFIILVGIIIGPVRKYSRQAKDVSAKLKSSEERFRQTFQQAPIGLAHIGVDGRWLLVNDHLCEMLGYEKDELLAQAFLEMTHPDDRAADLEQFQHLHNGDAANYAMEKRYFKKNGETIWVHHSVALVRGGDGNPIYSINAVRNISAQKASEETLLARKKQLRRAFDNSPVGVVHLDQKGVAIDCNQQMEPILGARREDILNFNTLERIENAEMVKAIKHAISGYESSYEGEYVSVTGRRTAYVRFLLHPVTPGFSPSEVIGTAEDITERIQAEATLKEREARLRAIFEAARDTSFIIATLDGDDAKVSEFSPGAEYIFGYSREEVIGKSINMLYLPEHEARFFSIHQQLRETQASICGETMLLQKNGTPFPALFSAYPLLDNNGDLYATLIVSNDMTDQRKTQAALKESEKRLRDLVEKMPIMMDALDENYNLIMWNRECENVTGYSAEEVVGNPHALEMLYPDPSYREHVLESFDLTSDFRGKEYTLKSKGGEDRVVSWYNLSVSHPIPGWSSWALGIDVTGRKVMEQEILEAKEMAEQASKTRSDFLANMSHEIRTPMNAIIGMTDIVLQTSLTFKQRDYIDIIHSSARSLLRILNDILDFSKMQAGKLSFEETEFGFDEVLQGVSNLVCLAAQEKGLEFLYRIAPDVPRRLRGDSLRLTQVITNLASNAVKFTEEGEVVIVVRVVEHRGAGIVLRIEVSDTGIGLSEEQKDKLFMAFTQADESTTREYGGTGLGLSIAKGIVDLMDGDIGVESNPGEGATFWFSVYLEVSDQQPEFRVDEIPSGLNVLVVDDNKTSQNILRELLELAAFEVDVASSGEAALDMLQAGVKSYDLVIMDWILSGMDGVEASSRIKSNELLIDIPIILMGAVAEHGRIVRQAADRFALDGFLVKPVSQSGLFNTILEVFGESNVPLPWDMKQSSLMEVVHERLNGCRVLVAEDNAINQKLIVELLKRAGIVSTVASNGLEVLELARSDKYDAIIMDIQMPQMDGLEATRILRTEEQFNHVPIIAMTAHAMPDDREKSLAAGMNAHITKPVCPDHLFQILSQWITSADSSCTFDHASIDSVSSAMQPKPVPESNDVVPLPAMTSKERSYVDEPLVDPDSSFEDAVLAGTTIAGGLSLGEVAGRFGNNYDLLAGAYKRFIGTHAQSAKSMGTLIESGLFEQVQREAHILRGVAGNLGMTSVERLAARLEMDVAQGDTGELAVLVQELDDALVQVVESLALIAGRSDEHALSGQDGGRRGIDKLINECMGLIVSHDYGAGKLVGKLYTELEGTSIQPIVKQAMEALVDFDYSLALKKMEELSEESGDV